VANSGPDVRSVKKTQSVTHWNIYPELDDGRLTRPCLTDACDCHLTASMLPAKGPHHMRMLGVALVIALSLAATTPADADGRRREFRGEFRGDFRGSRRFDHHHHHHGGFVHRPAFPVFVGPSLIVGSPDVVAPPVVYAPPPSYYAPPGLYAPPAAYGWSALPPVPRVVEFSAGRYELRGDGVYSPYQWVWIPNPPTAPPPAPLPAASAPPPPAPEPAPRRSAAQTASIYRWTDELGVTTWTDSLEKVPVRYRGQTGRLTP
jgi:hypothetical protein